jgi:hypothetical protein
MPSVEVNGSTIHVLGVVKGLVAESKKVEEAFSTLGPEAVGLSVSKEELAALKVKEDYSKYEMSTLEEVYSVYVESFGPVALPTPAYVRAMELCEERAIPILPLDMNDEEYTEAYCERIGAMEIARESFFTRSIARKKFDISSPEAFALDWDRRINKAKGFRELERERERHMALSLTKMASRYRSILALVELERADGVLFNLHRLVQLA